MNRREHLIAVGSTVALGGCLQFTEAETDGADAGTSSRSTSTDRSGSGEGASPTEADTESLPSGTRWIFEASAPYLHGPRHHEGTVFATSIDRHLYGLDAEDGAKRWSLRVETELDKGLSVTDGFAIAAGTDEQASVAIDDGSTVYRSGSDWDGIRAQAGGAGIVYQARFPTGLRAVRPASGTESWTVENDKPAMDVASDGDVVCAGFEPDGNFGRPPWEFVGYDAATGDRRWRVERSPDVDASNPRVVVSDGVCFAVGGREYQVSIDARDGRTLAESRIPDFGTLHGARTDVVLLTVGGGLEGRDIATGDVRWQSSDAPGRNGDGYFDGSTFWFVSDGDLHSVDVGDGTDTRHGPVDLEGASIERQDGLCVTDESVFVCTEDAKLRALERP